MGCQKWKGQTAPFSDDRRIEDLIALHKGTQKNPCVENSLRLSSEAQGVCNAPFGDLEEEGNNVQHSALEESSEPPGFTREDAKGGGGTIPKEDDDFVDDMNEARKSWSLAKHMGCGSEDEYGVLKAIAKIKRKARKGGKEPKSKKQRKHKRKLAKEV